MTNKIYDSAANALANTVKDGMTIMVGGFGLCGMPATLIEALRDSGARNLTCVSNNAGIDGAGLALLLETRQIAKMISSYVGNNKLFSELYLSGAIELEFCPQGTLAERCRAGGAGIAAFYTRTGVGTLVAENKEVRAFDGQDYIMETGIVADIALVKAEIADEDGNLIYRKTAQNFNPDMAMGGRLTIAEVEQITPVGSLDPDHIHTPGIFVQRVIKSHHPKRIEIETTRPREPQA
ncbi:CoA transferase subunit A [Kordiimonas pumila]|uniref:CoA transferase subunit A n=1 Tax=Kordiimonas pumila TaxID=2161677 RepID=A0ABV7D571_9PROT|nr:CoA transferase subunit A [Kordiimonas pumila]